MPGTWKFTIQGNSPEKTWITLYEYWRDLWNESWLFLLGLYVVIPEDFGKLTAKLRFFALCARARTCVCVCVRARARAHVCLRERQTERRETERREGGRDRERIVHQAWHRRFRKTSTLCPTVPWELISVNMNALEELYSSWLRDKYLIKPTHSLVALLVPFLFNKKIHISILKSARHVFRTFSKSLPKDHFCSDTLGSGNQLFPVHFDTKTFLLAF